MMGLPKVIQEAGILPVTVLLLVFAVFSSLCSVLFAGSFNDYCLTYFQIRLQ